MLRKMKTGFKAAVRLIAAENANALRNFAKDAGGVISRLGQTQKHGRLRRGKGLT